MRSRSRSWLPFALVALFAAVLVNCTGCGSKLQDAYATRTVFNAAVEEGLKLHAAGKISDDQMLASEPIVTSVPPLLDELDRAALAGDAFRWAAAYDSASNALDKLLAWLAETRARK